MKTLFDLTHRRSGIVKRSGRLPFICDDWSHILGLPLRVGTVIIGLYEPIRPTIGHYYDDLRDWTDGLDIGGRRPPERGMVYDVDGEIVICPDEWD